MHSSNDNSNASGGTNSSWSWLDPYTGERESGSEGYSWGDSYSHSYFDSGTSSTGGTGVGIDGSGGSLAGNWTDYGTGVIVPSSGGGSGPSAPATGGEGDVTRGDGLPDNGPASNGPASNGPAGDGPGEGEAGSDEGSGGYSWADEGGGTSSRGSANGDQTASGGEGESSDGLSQTWGGFIYNWTLGWFTPSADTIEEGIVGVTHLSNHPQNVDDARELKKRLLLQQLDPRYYGVGDNVKSPPAGQMAGVTQALEDTENILKPAAQIPVNMLASGGGLVAGVKVRYRDRIDDHVAASKPSQRHLGNLPDPPKPKKAPITKANSPIWRNFSTYRGQTKTNGKSGSLKRYYEWDHTHGDIEIYDQNGRHLGTISPETGAFIKPAVPGRTIEI